MSGTLFLVATPIGNLEDITLRALRVLREVSVIAAEDTRRTSKLLTHYGITTPTTSLHAHNERGRVPSLIRRLQAGENVAVVTDAGMPTVSDPGFLIVRKAIDEGIRVDVIPGASALITAIAGSGLPADHVTFAGFAPARAGERKRWLTAIGQLPGTIVWFEAPQRLQDSLNALLETLGDRRVVVAHELTKIHESWHRGFVSELLENKSLLPDKGEFTILMSAERQSAEDADASPFDHASLLSEFGELTESAGLSRREAIAELASRRGISKRAIYSRVEEAKKSGE
jgi:16S rRNA (cytidine1402-2'-O)-methyltransferase